MRSNKSRISDAGVVIEQDEKIVSLLFIFMLLVLWVDKHGYW
jgi:hypothetical protein